MGGSVSFTQAGAAVYAERPVDGVVAEHKKFTYIKEKIGNT